VHYFNWCDCRCMCVHVNMYVCVCVCLCVYVTIVRHIQARSHAWDSATSSDTMLSHIKAVFHSFTWHLSQSVICDEIMHGVWNKMLQTVCWLPWRWWKVSRLGHLVGSRMRDFQRNWHWNRRHSPSWLKLWAGFAPITCYQLEVEPLETDRQLLGHLHASFSAVLKLTK
jgi:hypothetical protein